MIYRANALGEIYSILESLEKPIAVSDFFCGEWGYEAMASQSLARQFYVEHHDRATVVALCWRGCSLLYSNTADVQIEFDNDASIVGNPQHSGEYRYRYLRECRHTEMVNNISGIVGRLGPAYWLGGPYGHPLSEPLTHYMEIHTGYSADIPGMLEYIADYFKAEAPTFTTRLPPPIDVPYIALFDRNDSHCSERNLQDWHIDLFKELAERYSYKLIVMSGLYPRDIGADYQIIIRHRDVDALCALAQNAAVIGCPPSGAGESAIITGCNMVTLGGSLPQSYCDYYSDICASRGYEYFGKIETDDDVTLAEMEKYLWLNQPTRIS